MAKTLDFIVRLRDQASKALKGVEGSLGRLQTMASNPVFSSLGAFFGASAAIGVVGSMIKTMGSYEESLNKLGAVSDASAADMQRLSNSARELGATTRYSASEAAQGMTYLAMAGLDVNQIIGAMPSVLQLATAANMDLAQAADVATNILTGYGMAVEDLAHANDVLLAAAIKTNVDVPMLGESMKYIGPVASQLGVKFEQVTAAIGLMGNAGIQGSMAGTSLRGVLTRLASPTDKEAGLMKKLGLANVKAKDGSIDLIKVVQGLEQNLKKGMSEAQVAALTMELFGDRAGPGMMALLSQGSEALIKLTGELENADGIAAETARRMEQGLNAQLRELSSAWEEFTLTIGDTGVLLQAVEGVKFITLAMRELTDNVKDQGFWSGMFASITGTMLEWSGFMVDTFLSVGQSIATALAGVFGDEVAADVNAHFQKMRDGLQSALSWMSSLLSGDPVAWDTLFTSLAGAWDSVKVFFSQVWAAIKGTALETWTWITESASSAVEALKGVWQSITEFFSGLWQGIVDGARSLVDGIVAVGAGIVDFFSWLWQSVVSTVQGAVSAIIGAWQSFVTWLFTTFPQIPEIIRLVVAIIARLWELAVAQAQVIIAGIVVVWEAVSEAVMAVVNVLVEYVISAWTAIVTTARAILIGIVGVFEGIWAAVSGALASVASVIVDAWNAMVGALTTIFDSIYQAAVSLWDKISTAASGPLTTLANTLEEALNGMLNAVDSVMEAISARFVSAFGAIKTLVFAVSILIKTAFSNALNRMKEVADRILDAILEKVRAVANAIGLKSIWPDLMTRMVAVTEAWATKSDQLLYDWSRNTISIHVQTAEAIKDNWQSANKSLNAMQDLEAILPSRYRTVTKGPKGKQRQELDPDREAIALWDIYEKNMSSALGVHEAAVLREQDLYMEQIEKFRAFAHDRGTSQETLNRWLADAATAHGTRLVQLDQNEINRRRDLYLRANEDMMTEYDMNVLREQERYTTSLQAFNEYAMLMNLSKDEMYAYEEQANMLHQQNMDLLALQERDRQYQMLTDTVTMWAELLNITSTHSQLLMDTYMQLGMGVSDAFAQTLGSIWAGVKQDSGAIEKALIGLLGQVASTLGDFFVKEGLTFIAAGLAHSIMGLPNGPALMGAGAAEVAAGTLLKALGAAGQASSQRDAGAGMGGGYGYGAGGFNANIGGQFGFDTGGGIPGRGTAEPQMSREGRVVIDVTHLKEDQIVTDIPGMITTVVTEINRAARRDIEINFVGE